MNNISPERNTGTNLTYNVVVIVANVPEQKVEQKRDINSSKPPSTGRKGVVARGGGESCGACWFSLWYWRRKIVIVRRTSWKKISWIFSTERYDVGLIYHSSDRVLQRHFSWLNESVEPKSKMPARLTNPPSKLNAGLLVTPLKLLILLVFGAVVNPNAETAPRHERNAMEQIFMVVKQTE